MMLVKLVVDDHRNYFTKTINIEVFVTLPSPNKTTLYFFTLPRGSSNNILYVIYIYNVYTRYIYIYMMLQYKYIYIYK